MKVIMSTLSYLCILSYLYLFIPLWSQSRPDRFSAPEPKQHIITLTAGAIMSGLPDSQFSTNDVTGIATLQYEVIGKKIYHILNMHAGVSLETYTSAGSNFFLPDALNPYQDFKLQYEMLFRTRYFDPYAFYLGISLEKKLSLWNTAYSTFTTTVRDHRWTGSTTLGLAAVAYWNWDFNRFRIYYALPIIGTASQSIFSEKSSIVSPSQASTQSVFFEDLFQSMLGTFDLFSWASTFSTSLDIVYERKFANWMAFVFHYGVEVEYPHSTQKTFTLDALTQKVNIGVSFFW